VNLLNYSPLRYPGGKTKLTPLIRLSIEKTAKTEVTYIEPFAGGAGVALNLLFSDAVTQIVINDYDKAIYSFWRALLESPQEIIQLVQNTPLTIDEWHHQKDIYCKTNNRYSVELGFAAFFLNRTNRSGILSAGPIGGYDQAGDYGIDARFNRENLIARIKAIARRKSQIKVYNKEIRSFIRNVIPKYEATAFAYFDPPYYKNGQRLYKNSFLPSDHAEIAHSIMTGVNCPWIITYDDVPQIEKIYSAYTKCRYHLNYSAANKGAGSELMIFKTADLMPSLNEVGQCIGSFQLI